MPFHWLTVVGDPIGFPHSYILLIVYHTAFLNYEPILRSFKAKYEVGSWTTLPYIGVAHSLRWFVSPKVIWDSLFLVDMAPFGRRFNRIPAWTPCLSVIGVTRTSLCHVINQFLGILECLRYLSRAVPTVRCSHLHPTGTRRSQCQHRIYTRSQPRTAVNPCLCHIPLLKLI